MTLAARLAPHGLLEHAREIAAALDVELEQLPAHERARTKLELAMVARGWHPLAAARVVAGVAPAPCTPPAATASVELELEQLDVDEDLAELQGDDEQLDEEPPPRHAPASPLDAALASGVEGPSRDLNGERRGRVREARPRTLNATRLPRREMAIARAADPAGGRRHLPMTRGDCVDGDRPCLFVSCVHHLALDVDPHNGSIKFNFPDVFDGADVDRLEDLEDTCALDVADRDGAILFDVGRCLNVTRERARQIENRALERLAKNRRARVARELLA